MQLFRSHGITRDINHMTKVSEGDWYYQQIDLGLNYRMTELQAALGMSQLKRIDGFVTRRHELAERYKNLLKVFLFLCHSGPKVATVLFTFIL